MEMPSGESDPVIKEIPVYVSTKLKDQLYLFQYPIRPSSFPYASNSIFAARIKPVQGRVELSVSLDTSSEDYDQSKGEQIALNVDGFSSAPSEKDFPNGLMDKQLLTSSRTLKDPSRYAIGLISPEGKLHLNAIKDTLVIRPDLTYLDKSDKTAKSEGRTLTNNPEEQELEEALEEENDLKQVTVKFAKTDNETFKKNREKTYDYKKNKDEMEKWVPMKYNPHQSETAKAEYKKLYCDKEESSALGEKVQAKKESYYLENLKG
uniref:DNA-directed RNA polymerase III subunit RPC5 n=1 Tax=Caligus clemensi TaxID=344056 RepID=C1C379_CALCM|nr:DNA-directed RNA polymerase III subunit RPC5 [Caligus clemensi]